MPQVCSILIHQFSNFLRMWYQQLPKLSDNLRQQCSRRPGSVRPARVPTAFQQVISPSHVHKSTRAGTCPCWTSDSPTTFTCMLICIRAWPASAGCPSTDLSPTTCSRRGRYTLKNHLPQRVEEVPWIVAGANATHDKTSGVDSPRH